MAKDILPFPQIPGPRYVINKTMAWICVALAGVAGTAVGLFIGLLISNTC